MKISFCMCLGLCQSVNVVVRGIIIPPPWGVLISVCCLLYLYARLFCLTSRKLISKFNNIFAPWQCSHNYLAFLLWLAYLIGSSSSKKLLTPTLRFLKFIMSTTMDFISYNFLSNLHINLRNWWSADDFIVLLTDSWSFSFRNFNVTLAVRANISKVFTRFWSNASIYMLHSFGIFSFLCACTEYFIYSHTIGVVVDGHCFSLYVINSSVYQRSVV